MDTKDYIIVGLSVALTLTLVAVIIVLVSGKAQMKNPRFYSGDIMDEVDAAIRNGEVVAPDVDGIEAEARRLREVAERSRFSNDTLNAIAADYLEL
uniref:Uncharacterized protein n=1 Tax=viral metagenome TaxID=1070528 RepID=A0A6C0LUL8_9ZZZZ